jgi:hypothetical protein
MPALNWDIFTSLPGGQEVNFELLCRGIIRRCYDQHGIFRARANQPGIEFHLRIKRACSLGDDTRWWGWQCKWYDLPSGKSLGKNRRDTIEDGIRKTEKYVPGVTDWVLWTRHTLTADDQEWFNGISTDMDLHLWTSDEVDNLLSGEAAILRSTYFGELILRPQLLTRLHEQAVAPIRRRWVPDVHEVLEAEETIHRMLGNSQSWSDLSELADQLQQDAEMISKSRQTDGLLGDLVKKFESDCLEMATAVRVLYDNIGRGDLDALRNQLNEHLPPVTSEMKLAGHQLRRGGHQVSLAVSNALSSLQASHEIVRRIDGSYSTRMVAVIAKAGCGKTQLSAQLTSGTPERLPGILIHGRDLAANGTLDDLARRIVIGVSPVPSMEALLAALDATGQRAQSRLPLVIDALNEAEDPRVWRSLLSTLEKQLERYPHVLVVCTVRPDFLNESLPDGIMALDIPGFEGREHQAIRSYFNHYMIELSDVLLPWYFLSHPLTLRLFCEATNPDRRSEVVISSVPGTLTEVFERYLDQCAQRIFETSPRMQRLYQQDVTSALKLIGSLLWTQNCRMIEINNLREALHDRQRPWDQSLVRALEQEGVLIKLSDVSGQSFYAPVYDALAGHLVAESLVASHTAASFGDFLKQPEAEPLWSGDHDTHHPFAADICASLVHWVPRRFYGTQLWTMLDEEPRELALFLSSQTQGAHLGREAVDALVPLVVEAPAHRQNAFGRRQDILNRLMETRGFPSHPLNAQFLDRCLRQMSVAERDLRWSEWMRNQHKTILRDIEWLCNRWEDGLQTGDHLRARWVMWVLTSTMQKVRDQATLALYLLGLNAPQCLFELTIDSLEINDNYVSERMLAASYGVVMGHQYRNEEFAISFASFLRCLAVNLLGSNAQLPTYHWLARLYVKQMLLFAKRFYPDCVPDGIDLSSIDFAPGESTCAISDTDERFEEVRYAVPYDFYKKVESLCFRSQTQPFSGGGIRTNEVESHVRGVVWENGWRKDSFGELDRTISREQHEDWRKSPYTDDYGVKYSNIGFYTFAGMMDNEGVLREESRLSQLTIDPSFPGTPARDPDLWPGSNWLCHANEDHVAWACGSRNNVPKEIIYRPKIGNIEGPWIAVYGNLERSDLILARRADVVFQAFAVQQEDVSGVVGYFNARQPNWKIFSLPADYYVFAGECSWSDEFSGCDAALYQVDIACPDERKITLEGIAHCYGFESYHSELNNAQGTFLPSGTLLRTMDLRGVRGALDQVTESREVAAISLGAPEGFEGQVLYIKKTVLDSFLCGRALVWYGCGARFPCVSGHRYPDWWRQLSLEQTWDSWVLSSDDFG